MSIEPNKTKRKGLYPIYNYIATVKQLNGGADVVYEEDSVIRIAERLHVATTTVSNLIKKKSRYKGITIERVPTRFGEHYLNVKDNKTS